MARSASILDLKLTNAYPLHAPVTLLEAKNILAICPNLLTSSLKSASDVLSDKFSIRIAGTSS